MSIKDLSEQYFIRARSSGSEDFQLVDMATYVRHERSAGFGPSHGQDKSKPCTASFLDSRYPFEGKIVFAPKAS